MASFYVHRNSNFNEPCNHFQFSILHVAVLGIGNTEKQAKMIEYIVNNISETVINETDVYGRTPLFCAAQYKKHKLGEVLLGLGADPEVITSFKYSALGMASTSCPNLMMSLMDWALEKEKEDPSRSIMTKSDVQILYNTKVDNKLMLHPYIKHIIGDINKGKTLELQLITLLCYVLGTVCVNWLCMTNEHEANGYFEIDGSIEISQILYRIAILLTIVLIVIDFYQAKEMVHSVKMIKVQRDDLQSLSGYKSTPYHPDISADKAMTIKQAQSMQRVMVKKAILHSIELVICLLGKVTVLACQFMPNEVEKGEINTRDYLLSAALVLIWWELYRKLLWLTIMPDCLVVYGLVVLRCMFAIIEIMLVAFIIAIPFILILVKISFMQNMTVYVGDNNTNVGQTILFVIGHIFKLLTLDNFHDYDFEREHSIFLSFFYPVAMSIFSLVVLNMCIAKLSIEYKFITDNAQYEINRQRLYIKVEWDTETIKEERAMSVEMERIKSCFCCT
ncbi:uncharacterized protein LOC134817506 [Bolinopsis microptera]|uniref:uncharacterized protein LOC134817506 n=1 Tax=Bolinopsis microptera TaxID=2820187 RepID=UPI003078FACF